VAFVVIVLPEYCEGFRQSLPSVKVYVPWVVREEYAQVYVLSFPKVSDNLFGAMPYLLRALFMLFSILAEVSLPPAWARILSEVNSTSAPEYTHVPSILFELVPKVSEMADLILEKILEICAEAVFAVPKATRTDATKNFNFMILYTL